MPAFSESQCRVFVDKAHPRVFKALMDHAAAAGEAVREAGVPRLVAELVNVRCSQLNGCPYCLNLHVRLAYAAGASEQLLAVLPAWRETDLFDDLAKAALEIAELVTLLPEAFAADAAYDRAADVLTEEQLSALIWAAIAINASNRVSILSRHPVRPAAPPYGASRGAGDASERPGKHRERPEGRQLH